MFRVQRSRWELLLAAPNFTSLKGFVCFYFSQKKHTFIGSLWLQTQSRQQRQRFRRGHSLWTAPARLLSLCSHSGPWILRRLRRRSHLTPPTPPAKTQVRRVFFFFFGCTFSLDRFTSFLFLLSQTTLTQTWQKHLIPAGGRSGCAAARFALRGFRLLCRCRWWK